jgi:hypothetical protein
MLNFNFFKRKLKIFDLKCFLIWIISIFIIFWLINNLFNFENCAKNSQNSDTNAEFIRINDNIQIENRLDSTAINKNDIFPYNRNIPLIFVGGVPRSGTTLMRAMLDAHPSIRCGEETRIIPRLIYMRNQWSNSKKEMERLKNAGMSDDIIDSAVGAFILEVIVKHGKPAENLCNKDPLVLRYSSYMKKVFPKAKFLLMVNLFLLLICFNFSNIKIFFSFFLF